MPLWNVYHPVGAYTDRQKQELAADITAFYAGKGLPKFYVVTLFHEIDESSFLVGGAPTSTTVRIMIDHIARHQPDAAARKDVAESLSRLLAPHTWDRGLNCEFHIDETPRDLWTINGLFPPASGSEADQLWVRENRPVPY